MIPKFTAITSRCANCGASYAREPDSEHLALIVEAAPIATVVTDATGVLRFVNSRAQALIGYDSHEMVGQPLEMLLPERFRGAHPALHAGYTEDASPRPMGAGRDLFGLVRDGVEAIALATSNPNLCLMLLDLKMPWVDGIDVLQSIRANERTCCIPILILTSSSQESDILEAYRSGANGYIVKPFDIEKLSEVVGAMGAYWLNVNRAPRR